MRMGSQRVELNAINLLSSVLLKTGYIIPLISKGDTTPSWDGELLLYRERFSDKKDDIRKIQIQVKGRSRDPKDFRKDKVKFKVDRKDLINFEQNGGAIYFLVLMSDFDKYRIFYNALTPFDLRRIINDCDDDANLIFKALPDNLNNIIDICINFFENSRKQHSINIPTKYDLATGIHPAFDKYTASFYSIFQNKIDSIFHTPLYIYGNISGIPVAIEKIDDVDAIELTVMQSITIGNHSYEVNTVTEKDKDMRICMRVGSCFVLYNDSWSFKLQGTLKERIQCLKILLDIKKSHVIQFSNFDYTIPDENIAKKDVDNANHDLNNLCLIRNALEFYGIYTDLDLDSLEHRKDKGNLGLICYSYENDGFISTQKLSPPFVVLSCCNLRIAIFCKQASEDKCKLISAFDSTFATSSDNNISLNVDDREIWGSSYLDLKREHFTSLSNINYTSFFDSLTSMEHSDDHEACLVRTNLEMIKAYDDEKDMALLDACIKLSEWIKDQYPKPHTLIN